MMDGSNIIRKIIIIGLVAAIGAVAMIQHASAGQTPDFCRDHPGWPGCEYMNQHPTPPGPARPPVGQTPPPVAQGGWHHQGHRDGDPNFGIYLGFGPGEPPPPPYGAMGLGYPGKCRDIALDLSDQGFEHVRPLRCTGPRLIFSAWRDGDKLFLYVNRFGRIVRIVPAY